MILALIEGALGSRLSPVYVSLIGRYLFIIARQGAFLGPLANGPRWRLLNHHIVLLLVVEEHAVPDEEVNTVMVLEGKHDPDGLWILVLNDIMIQSHVTVLAEVLDVLVKDPLGLSNLDLVVLLTWVCNLLIDVIIGSLRFL